MRAFEQDLKSYTKAKITNIKEDILRKGHKVKRTLRLMLEASQSEDGSKWRVRLEGRVIDALTQGEILAGGTTSAGSKRFLELFKRAKVEFLKVGDSGLERTNHY